MIVSRTSETKKFLELQDGPEKGLLLAPRGADWNPLKELVQWVVLKRTGEVQVQARCSPNCPSVMRCPEPADWVQVLVVMVLIMVLMMVVVMLGAQLSDLTMDRSVAVANTLKKGKPSLESIVYNQGPLQLKEHLKINLKWIRKLFKPQNPKTPKPQSRFN